MPLQNVDELLQQSLSDYRISRGEKQALRHVLEEAKADPRELALLRSRAFEIARQDATGPEAKQIIEWLEGVVKLLLPGDAEPTAGPHAEALFSPADDCAQSIIRLLNQARSDIDICVFTITDDRIRDAIWSTHQRGVTVRIVSDGGKAADLGSDIENLRRRGVPVRMEMTEHHMHHKFAVIDGEVALTGSYNWTRAAALYNQENLLIVRDRRLARRFTVAFDQLWDQLR